MRVDALPGGSVIDRLAKCLDGTGVEPHITLAVDRLPDFPSHGSVRPDPTVAFSPSGRGLQRLTHNLRC